MRRILNAKEENVSIQVVTNVEFVSQALVDDIGFVEEDHKPYTFMSHFEYNQCHRISFL